MTDHRKSVESGGFLLFLAFVTLAAAAVVWPFASALLWAGLAALMFQPLYRRMLGDLNGHENSAAIATLLVITFAVVVPILIVSVLIIDQASGVYQDIRNGQLDFAHYFRQVHDALPNRIGYLLDNSGLSSFELMRDRISEALASSAGAIATRALVIGRNALAFLLAFGIGLYATFFLLRDGRHIGPVIVAALPVPARTAERLVDKFVSVVRATIKGSIVVGLVQGGLGAITFWIVGVDAALLWGLMMAVTSLLPALGPAIIWVPVAIYLLATGAIWQAIVVIVSGVAVIGMADNILRPILVGRDTGIPDWIVLVATLGGIALTGLSGIVVGPVVVALFLTGWQIFSEERAAG